MSTTKIAQTSRTQLSGANVALNSLASGTYVAIGTFNHNNSGLVPLDTEVELTITPGTVSGNKQAVLFAQISEDGINFTSGPSSGTTTTDEPNLVYIGTLPLNTNAGQQRKIFSLAGMYPNNQLPFASKLIVKNDSGAAFASSGNDCFTQDFTGNIT